MLVVTLKENEKVLIGKEKRDKHHGGGDPGRSDSLRNPGTA